MIAALDEQLVFFSEHMREGCESHGLKDKFFNCSIIIPPRGRVS